MTLQEILILKWVGIGFLYAHRKMRRIMLWRCPPRVISVLQTFSCDLYSYCIETWFMAL